MTENGFTDELIEKWFYIPNCSTYQAEEQRFSWKYICAIIALIVICFGLGMVLILLENFYTFMKTKYLEKKEKNSLSITRKIQVYCKNYQLAR